MRNPAARNSGASTKQIGEQWYPEFASQTPDCQGSVYATPPLWLQRHAEALHARGARPLGELIWEIIAQWPPELEADFRAAFLRYNRIPAGVYAAVGGDRFPPIFAVLSGGRQ